ncbi:MAG: ABC transporter substrate-binding protein [Pseudomonadota bacterium]|nr:ABC transporter substrate-binding protein [Pseudomonadota bacterium]
MKATKHNALTFLYKNLKHPVSTSIFDSEYYSNNLVVAPMIATLVVYYSDERPVPFLAKSWHNDGNLWTFDLREGIKCENGELITADGMRKSLIRSLKWLSKDQEQPVFNKLKGYREFRKTGDGNVLGISSRENKLIFEFTEKFRSGFLEYLTMAPFGFICEDNYNGDAWKDKTRFISSGPYRLVEFEPGSHYTLEKRKDWPLNPDYTPDRVKIRNGTVDDLKDNSTSFILETSDKPKVIPKGFTMVRQMPGTLMTLSISTGKNRIFDDLDLRRIFSNKVKEKFKDRDLSDFSFNAADFFYFNQVSELAALPTPSKAIKKPGNVIKIRSVPKPVDSMTALVEDTLRGAFEDLDWPYEIFNSKDLSWEDFTDTKTYDIRRVGAEIGGGFEGWIADMLFCSKLGPKFADPSGRICALAKEYEMTELPIQQTIDRFNKYIHEDSALIPLFHVGGQYLMSSDIDTNSLSSLITRVRFDEIKFK